MSVIADFLTDNDAYVAVLTGYAGCGKTTIVKHIAELFGEPVVITPTGKAALRVTEATGISAITMHRFLYDASTDEETGNPIFIIKERSEMTDFIGKLIVVDEASMVGKDIWDDLLLTARMVGFQILLVGDIFQLPPVSKIKDGFSALEFKTKYRATLTEVHRQALESPIIRASMILRSNRPEHEAMRLLTPIGASKLIETVLDVRSKGGAVICHTNKRRHSMNTLAREALGFKTGTLEEDEPLMVIKNNYKIDRYNGEIVNFTNWDIKPTETTQAIAIDRYTVSSLRMDFGVGIIEKEQTAMLSPTEITGASEEGKIGYGAITKAAKFAYGNIGERKNAPPFLHCNYGYALTCHKSQGSQFPEVLVIMENSLNAMKGIERKRWQYTAITRSINCVKYMYLDN
jgi:ATP-dependent exoDNAse (exonuclease V) alpha subunit